MLMVNCARVGCRHEGSVQKFAPQLGFSFECPPVDGAAMLADVPGCIWLAQFLLHLLEVLFSEASLPWCVFVSMMVCLE